METSASSVTCTPCSTGPPKQDTTQESTASQKVPVSVGTYKLDLTLEEQEKVVAQQLRDSDTIPEEVPVRKAIGKMGLMFPRREALAHPAAPLLLSYANEGCPVDCGDDWTTEHIELLLERGPHISAKDPDAIAQLIAETEMKIKQGYARVVTWGNIKKNRPRRLKISPVAMIPHKSKAFRCILDLSFFLRHKGKTYASVNDATNKKAKAEAMVQLGQSLRRIIHWMVLGRLKDSALIYYLAKLDIKDGFWRMKVSDEHVASHL